MRILRALSILVPALTPALHFAPLNIEFRVALMGMAIGISLVLLIKLRQEQCA